MPLAFGGEGSSRSRKDRMRVNFFAERSENKEDITPDRSRAAFIRWYTLLAMLKNSGPTRLRGTSRTADFENSGSS